MVEKIKVNLSYNTYHLLIKDMDSFSFAMKENQSNKNLFYNTVIKNMFIKKKKEEEIIRSKIQNILKGYLNNTIPSNDLINEMENIYNEKIEDKTNRSHGYYISFRPLKKMEDIYNEIEMEHLKNKTISAYFRNLFNEYAHLPQDEREAIVFADEILKINKAIENHKAIQVFFEKSSFEFIPYVLVKTQDEQYNYVVGGFMNKNQVFHTFSLHVYKLTHFFITKKQVYLSDEQKAIIDKQLLFGPREINQREATIKVLLTDAGKKLYRKMYLNRPIPFQVDDKENLYTFNGSIENVILYFKRFGKEAIIIEPEQIQNRMKKFYKAAFSIYDSYKAK